MESGMYSLARIVFSVFLIVLTTFSFTVVAAPENSSNGLSVQASDHILQNCIKALRGEQNGLTVSRAMDYLESFEMSKNRSIRSQARLWLGRAYRDGLAGTAKDERRSFHYFELAAGKEGGDPEAQYELAQAYYQGVGTDRNLIAAYMWVSLSLHQKTDISASAGALQETVSKLLNKDQLATAKTLVSQLENLYLNE